MKTVRLEDKLDDIDKRIYVLDQYLKHIIEYMKATDKKIVDLQNKLKQ